MKSRQLIDEATGKYIVWVKEGGVWQENGDGPVTQKTAERIARELRHDFGIPVKALPAGDEP
jgi:hypothetical protein